MLVLSWRRPMSALTFLSLMLRACALPSPFLQENRGTDERHPGQRSALPESAVPIKLPSTLISQPSRTQNAPSLTHTYYHLPTGFTHLFFSYGAPLDRRVFSTLVADARKEINSQWARYGDSEVPPGEDPFVEIARYETKLFIKSCGEACRLKYGLLKDIMTALAVFLVDEEWFYETHFKVFHDFRGQQQAEGRIARPSEESMILASNASAHEIWPTS